MKPIILAGPAGVGKSTTAAAIVKRCRADGRSAHQLSFAGPLYEMVATMTGVPVSQLKAKKEQPLLIDADGCLPWAAGRTPPADPAAGG